MKNSLLLCVIYSGILWAEGTEIAPFKNDTYIAEYEGREVTLQCKGIWDGRVEWLKQVGSYAYEVATKTGDNGKINYNGAWRGQVELRNDNSLFINRLNYTRDDGIFQCYTRRYKSSIKVDVLSNPSNVEIRDSWSQNGVKYLNVTRGKNTTVACGVKAGRKPVTYRWFLGDQDITETSFKSTVTYVFQKIHHNAKLKCTTTPSGSEGSVRVNVEYGPSTPSITPSTATDLEVDEESTVTLACKADGNPAPSIEWYRDDHFAYRGETYTIPSVQRKDKGSYSCKATNKVDTAKNDINIVVKYPPSVSLVYQEAANRLYCQVSEGYPEAYKFDKWVHQIAGRSVPITAKSETTDNALILDMSDASYRSSGTYFCYVTNGVRGKQTSVKEIPIRDKPAFAKQPTHFSGVTSEPLEITIGFWSDPPATEIKWLRRNGKNKLEVLTGKWFSLARRETHVRMEISSGFITEMPGYQTILNIRELAQIYCGAYKVMVKNAKGETTYDIFIVAETNQRSVIFIVSAFLLCVLLAGIILRLLFYFNIIRCPWKWCKCNKIESSDDSIKRPPQMKGRVGLHRTSCTRSSLSRQSLTVPKCPTLSIMQDSPDQRYIPMSATPSTPTTPTAPTLPDPEHAVSEICDYIQANLSQDREHAVSEICDYIQANVSHAPPPLRQITDPTYEDVLYVNKKC